MKKTIIIILALILVFSASNCVFAADGPELKQADEAPVKVMTIDQIKEMITEVSVEFPEAGIDVESDLVFAEHLLELPIAEQIDYFRTVAGGDPIESYTHSEEDGSYTTLNVYGILAYETYGINLGTITLSANLDIITGTKVWVNNFCGYLLANAWYYVDHTYDHISSSGWINGTPYYINGTGTLYLPANWQIQSTGGGYSEVHYIIYQTVPDPPFPWQTAFLRFNASTYNVTTGGVP